MSASIFQRRAIVITTGALLLACAGARLIGSATAQSGNFVMAPIQQLDEALLAIMKAGKSAPFQTRVQQLTPAVDQALDLPQILRLAIGPSWYTLSPDQQQHLMAAFRSYTLATYVENFDSYDGQRITIAPQVRTLSDGAQIVRTEIIPRSGEAHYIDYVMRRAQNGSWKASDILADGTISRVAVLRSDFGAMLASGGPSALVASLNRKAADLARG
jgi:phospholipid transport system substrate-binding protein